MAITLASKYLAELKKAPNTPNVVIELALDAGVKRFGYWARNGSGITRFPADGAYKADGSITAIGSDELEPFEVQAVLKSVSSLQNKLDPKTGYSTRGQLTVVIGGRDNFKGLIANNYLKNRRVTRRDGFIAPGFTYNDYAATFTGRVTDWSRKGDELTLTVSDDLIDASKKLPVENALKTQYIDFRNSNPVDIMTGILLSQLGIGASYVNSAQFTSERDAWLSGWRFDRVLTEPKEANEYLNELQAETNSFLIHDGSQISFKVFAPPMPGSAPEEWTENNHILSGSFSQKSGYKDGFFNRIVVYYDYDESGSDNEANYEAAVIAVDAASQDATQWNEVATKAIKSKWMRSRTYTRTANIGSYVVIYHVSRANGTGNGTLTYTKSTRQLRWTAPGDTIGEAVTLSKSGKYQVFSADKTKYIRVVVDATALPVDTGTIIDTVTISALNGDGLASSLAQKLLSRYRDPVATVSLDIDINNVAYNGQFIKPTDLKDLSTDEASEKGLGAWIKERLMLTSVRPDFSAHKVSLEAMEAKMYRRYGFISPAGYPDYPAATASQREYGFIGDANNKVNGGTVDGYHIW